MYTYIYDFVRLYPTTHQIISTPFLTTNPSSPSRYQLTCPSVPPGLTSWWPIETGDWDHDERNPPGLSCSSSNHLTNLYGYIVHVFSRRSSQSRICTPIHIHKHRACMELYVCACKITQVDSTHMDTYGLVWKNRGSTRNWPFQVQF